MSKLVDPHVAMLDSEGRKAWAWGFQHCLQLFAIWNDGVQRIGAMQTDIREIQTELKRELANFED